MPTECKTMNAKPNVSSDHLNDLQRLDLAKRLASGLAGWLHSMSAHMCGYLADEDAARLEVCQILQAQRAPFFLKKNVAPADWGENTRRMDVGIGVMSGDPMHYGGIELK